MFSLFFETVHLEGHLKHLFTASVKGNLLSLNICL